MQFPSNPPIYLNKMSAYMYGIIFSIILGIACAIIQKQVVAKEGDSLYLPCKGEDGFQCIWILINSGISSEVIAMTNDTSPPPRYNLTDTPQLGDCSLQITDIKPNDSATLSCSISPTSLVIRYEVIIAATNGTNEASSKISFFTSALYLMTALNLISQVPILTVF